MNSTKKESYLLKDEQEDINNKNMLSDFAALKILLAQARPEMFRYIGGIILIVLSSLSVIYSSYRLGQLFDTDLKTKDTNVLAMSAFVIVMLEIGHVLFKWLGKRSFSYASAATIFNIRKTLFSHFQSLPMKYFDRVPQGRIITRLTSDVDAMEEFFSVILGNVLIQVMMATIALVAMLVTDLKIGLLLTLAMVPVLLLLYYTKSLVKVLSRDVSVKTSSMNSVLAENINGIELIRAYGIEDWSMKEFALHTKGLQNAQLRSNLNYSFVRPLTSFLCSVPVLCLVYFGGNKIMNQTMTVGMFVAFVRYCDRFYNPIIELSYQFHLIQKAFSGLERILSFFKHLPEEATFEKGQNLKPNLHSQITINQLGLDYETKSNILKGISFDIRPGEKIGLLGRTGSGKTSIVSLLMRLYEFQRGNIFFGDISIRDIDKIYLRDKIGIVTQDVVIFEGCLRDNLKTSEGIKDSDLIAACIETGLIHVMHKNHITLDTLLKNGGSNLSVGERQLLSITRIFLKNPDILILDEATASIDPEFELVIKKAINKLMFNKTCLIIAHRLNTIEECDRLIVLKNGEIVEVGSFSELVNSKGPFFDLYYASQNKESVTGPH